MEKKKKLVAKSARGLIELREWTICFLVFSQYVLLIHGKRTKGNKECPWSSQSLLFNCKESYTNPIQEVFASLSVIRTFR